MVNDTHTVDQHEEEFHVYFEQEEEFEIAATPVWDEVSFSSVEDFLNAYLIASEGGDIAHLVSGWQAPFEDTELTSAVDNIKLTSLEALYLPVGIPDEFELRSIDVSEELILFSFLHPDDSVTEELNLFVFRWDELDEAFLINAMFEQYGIGEADLIDGKYYFRERSWGYAFDWVYNGTRFHLGIPLGQLNVRDEASRENRDGDMSYEDQLEAVGYAEIATINLQDTRAVEIMIEELEAARR